MLCHQASSTWKELATVTWSSSSAVELAHVFDGHMSSSAAYYWIGTGGFFNVNLVQLPAFWRGVAVVEAVGQRWDSHGSRPVIATRSGHMRPLGAAFTPRCHVMSSSVCTGSRVTGSRRVTVATLFRSPMKHCFNVLQHTRPRDRSPQQLVQPLQDTQRHGDQCVLYHGGLLLH